MAHNGEDDKEHGECNDSYCKTYDAVSRQPLLLLQNLILLLPYRFLLFGILALRPDDGRVKAFANLVGHSISRIAQSSLYIGFVFLEQVFLHFLQRGSRLANGKEFVQVAQIVRRLLPMARHCEIVAGVKPSLRSMRKVGLLIGSKSLAGLFLISNSFQTDS